MAASRRKSANRRKATRKTSGGVPAWFWLLGGILIGLGIAFALMFRGYLPELKQHLPTIDKQAAKTSESALIDKKASEADQVKKPRYDFFTVLPEMEVVVPEQELSRQAAPQSGTASGNGLDRFILQAGSFKNAADAEQMKARLALLGSVANVQTVTVNGETWHRVRLGPFEGARKANEVRRTLSENQIETLVMKANP